MDTWFSGIYEADVSCESEYSLLSINKSVSEELMVLTVC